MAKMFDEGLSALGTDNAISSGPYEPCSLWADALWKHPDRVDGIAYRSRFDNGQICLAVFERGTVTFARTVSRPLGSLTEEVAGLLDRYSKSLVDMDL